MASFYTVSWNSRLYVVILIAYFRICWYIRLHWSMYFEMHRWTMCISQLILKYVSILCSYSIVSRNMVPYKPYFISAFWDEILNEYGLAMYFGIQMCRRILWYLILRYSICWCFVFHHIQKYHTIWTGCQPYLKKRKAAPEAVRLLLEEKESWPEVVRLLLEEKESCREAVRLLLEKKEYRLEV